MRRRRSWGGGSPSGDDDGDDDVSDVGVFPGPASAGSSRSRCLDDPQLSPPTATSSLIRQPSSSGAPCLCLQGHYGGGGEIIRNSLLGGGRVASALPERTTTGTGFIFILYGRVFTFCPVLRQDCK